MKKWWSELTAGRQNLQEVTIERGVFQGNTHPKLQFVISMRKCTEGYKFTKSKEKINNLMYVDVIKLFAKNEKKIEQCAIEMEVDIRKNVP